MAVELGAQSLDQNFTMSVVPKVAMNIDEVNESVETSSATNQNITISTPENNQNFIALQSIRLKPGARLTPNVVLKINDITTASEDLFKSITYYDGLGRPIQSNAVRQSPNGNDIVQHYEYDQFGRTEKTYLPLPSNQNTGAFIDDPISQINTYYETTYGDSNPYSQQRFDKSPLSRPLESAVPGNDWQLSVQSNLDHTTKYEYGTNGVKKIRLFKTDTEGNLVPEYVFYYKNELLKSVIKNENWQPTDGKLNTKEIYTNKKGATIAKIDFANSNGNLEELITQYVYDNHNRLRYMIPPKANDKVLHNANYEMFSIEIPFENFLETPLQVQWQGSGHIALREFHTENNVITDYDFGSDMHFQFDDISSINGAFLKLGNIFTLPNNGTIVPDRHLFNIYRPGSNDQIWYEFSIKNGIIHNVLRANNGPDNDPQAAFRVSEINFDFREVIPAQFSINTVNFKELIFQYEYDEFGRQVAQKVPGKDWEYVIYDPVGYPILTQDANLRKDNLWLFTKKDAFGRPVYTGKYYNTKSREDLQRDVEILIYDSPNISNTEKRVTNTVNVSGVTINYTNNAFPNTNITEVLAVNYYDDYNFIDPDKPNFPTTIEGQIVTKKTKGLTTGNWTKTLGENSWSKLYTYYNENGIAIKVHEKNHLGGFTTTENKVDFRGKVEKEITKHRRTQSATLLTINDRYEYDNNERVKSQYQKINAQPEEHLVTNNYDELGNMQSKEIGGRSTFANRLQEINYKYNIRGWLKEINDVNNLGSDLFAYQLNYNDPIEAFNTEGNSLYNGNIAQNIWRSKHDNQKKSYIYQYDKMNRITDAKFLVGNTLVRDTNFKLEIQGIHYDANGNIKHLKRIGQNGTLDDLDYDYGATNGNQLKAITDNANINQGFTDGNTSGDDYEYDNNGNLIKDLNKGINSIEYNYLDLVKKVTFSNGHSIQYTYDGKGRKLSKIYANGINNIKTDYLGIFQYEQNQLQFVPNTQGYSYPDNTGNSFKYVYMISDHLGNNRVTYSDTNNDGNISTAELLSNTDYYPMGLIHDGEFTNSIASNYNYKYQGKELQQENNILMYDFGSRLYDPTVGRWFSTDPQNQYDSPYLAMGNNPVSMIDPNGEYVITASFVAGVIAGAYLGMMTGMMANQMQGKKFNDSSNIFKETAKGAVEGAIFGVSGVVGSAIETFSYGYSSVDIPVTDNFSITLSPALVVGTDASSIGVNVTANHKIGDFTISRSITGSFNNYAEGSGLSGFSGSGTAGINYDDGNFGISFSSSYFTGVSGSTERSGNQRVGGVGLRYKEFRFTYENDGTPFQWIGLGDGGDSFRSAAASIGYGDYSVGTNLFTGYRSYKGDPDEFDKKAKWPIVNQKDSNFPVTYKYGLVNEQGTKFRLGALYLGYKNKRTGINSERVRHLFQNVFAHDIVRPQGYFKVTSWDIKRYTQYKSYNSPFTSW